MTPRLLLAALLLLPTLCAAQPVKVTVKIPASQATFEIHDHVHPIPRELPTADELSGGSALSDYINAKLKAGEVCKLPGGVIRTDKPIDLYRVHGGRIEGVGMATGSSREPDGFRTSAKVTQAHTTIVGPDPVFRLRACQGLSIEHLTIEGDGAGVSYEHVPGWPSNYLTLHKVAFGTAVGLRAGLKETDHNAADVTLTDCYFSRCKTGLEVNHLQGVNYRLSGCNFLMVDTAVLLNHGGLVHLLDCFGFVQNWLVIKAGGPNLMPCRITNLNSDREPSHRPPVIVDASEATDVVRVIVDGVKVTANWGDGEKHPGHAYYRQPKNGEIRVRDDDLNSYAEGRVK